MDTIRYHLPEGFAPEYVPPTVQLKSRFGEYESSLQTNGNTVIYVRRLKIMKGEFPPESYTELVDFLKNVSRSDQQKLVIKPKT
jgi:hypothetical protein